MKRKTVNVKVTALNDNHVPLSFPWVNGVDINIMRDVSDLKELQKELSEIKDLVNVDLNRWKMNLKDFAIKIKWN